MKTIQKRRLKFWLEGAQMVTLWPSQKSLNEKVQDIIKEVKAWEDEEKKHQEKFPTNKFKWRTRQIITGQWMYTCSCLLLLAGILMGVYGLIVPYACLYVGIHCVNWTSIHEKPQWIWSTRSKTKNNESSES